MDIIRNKINSAKEGIHCFQIKDNRYLFKRDKSLILRVNSAICDFFNGISNVDSLQNSDRDFLISLDKLGYFDYVDPQIEVHTLKRCHLYLDFSNKCNLKCAYCFVQRKEIYQSEVSRSIDFINNFIMRNKHNFNEFIIDFCCFGEPSLFFKEFRIINEYIQQLSRELKKVVKLTFTTNGIILSKEMIKYFIKYKIQFGLSLDGDMRLHNQNRFNTYREIMDNLTFYREESKSPTLKYLWVSTVINKAPEDFVNILRHHVDLGFRAVIIKPSRQLECQKEISSLKDSYWRLTEYFIEKYREGDIKYLSAILNASDYFGKYIRSLIRNERILWRCGAGRQLFLMTHNGCITPCLQFHGDFSIKLGDYNQDIDMDKMLSLEKTQCKTCWAQTLCGGMLLFKLFLPK